MTGLLLFLCLEHLAQVLLLLELLLLTFISSGGVKVKHGL